MSDNETRLERQSCSMTCPSVEIISIGNELLLGKVVNTNATFLAQELTAMGCFVKQIYTIPDDKHIISAKIADAINKTDIIITTGGLGPTSDDITKETIANLLNIELVFDEHSWSRINQFFRKFNRPVTENNRRQAMMPEGAIVFDNDNGTAPAVAIKLNDKIIIMLPGPPRELQPIFIHQAKPFILSSIRNTGVLITESLKTFGIGESMLETRIKSIVAKHPNFVFATYAKMGEVELSITTYANENNSIQDELNQIMLELEAELSPNIYSTKAGSLQEALVQKLIRHQLTIATAESCTGGYIAKRITEIPGSSNVFMGSIVAYSNDIKVNFLEVDKSLLENFGAVSEEVAKQMAKNVALKFNTTFGVSTSGIASPISENPNKCSQNYYSDKEIGLVWIGFYDARTNENYAVKFNLSRGYVDDRENIRHLSTLNAMFIVINKI